MAKTFSATGMPRRVALGVAGLGLVALLGAALPAVASGRPAAEAISGRYTMQPTDGGFLRLDTSSGAVSFCRTRSGSFVCEAVADDRLALEDELKRLRQENDELKSTVKKLEEIAGLPTDKDLEKRGTLPDTGKGGFKLPTEEEVDKAMSYVERMLKKFKDKLKDLEAETGKKGTPL